MPLPAVRRILALLLVVMLAPSVGSSAMRLQNGQSGDQDIVIDAPQPFDVWLDGVIAEARMRGFSEELIKQTLVGLEPLPQVVRSDRNQAELNPGFARYLTSHLPSSFVRQGREAVAQHASLLRQIEERFGVPGPVVAAVWGI